MNPEPIEDRRADLVADEWARACGADLPSVETGRLFGRRIVTQEQRKTLVADIASANERRATIDLVEARLAAVRLLLRKERVREKRLVQAMTIMRRLYSDGWTEQQIAASLGLRSHSSVSETVTWAQNEVLRDCEPIQVRCANQKCPNMVPALPAERGRRRDYCDESCRLRAKAARHRARRA